MLKNQQQTNETLSSVSQESFFVGEINRKILLLFDPKLPNIWTNEKTLTQISLKLAVWPHKQIHREHESKRSQKRKSKQKYFNTLLLTQTNVILIIFDMSG